MEHLRIWVSASLGEEGDCLLHLCLRLAQVLEGSFPKIAHPFPLPRSKFGAPLAPLVPLPATLPAAGVPLPSASVEPRAPLTPLLEPGPTAPWDKAPMPAGVNGKGHSR
jgi:hypothetical protein